MSKFKFIKDLVAPHLPNNDMGVTAMKKEAKQSKAEDQMAHLNNPNLSVYQRNFESVGQKDKAQLKCITNTTKPMDEWIKK